MRFNIIVLFLFIFCASENNLKAQLPFYYKIKHVEGKVYDNKGNEITIRFKSRNKLLITNCKSIELDSFFRCLTIDKIGRKQLEFLLKTSSKITVIVSPKIGVMYKDGKYRLMAAMTGPTNHQSNLLIENRYHKIRKKIRRKPNRVREESTIEIFKGTLIYAKEIGYKPKKEELKLFDWQSNEEIVNFSMDTVKIEPIKYQKMLYMNQKELYYFVGVHEIVHIQPENIDLQIEKKDSERDAMLLETKAFKNRKKINKRSIKKSKTII